jgi:high-affinity iron transporter
VAMYFIYLVPALVLFAMPPRTGTQATRVAP